MSILAASVTKQVVLYGQILSNYSEMLLSTTQYDYYQCENILLSLQCKINK